MGPFRSKNLCDSYRWKKERVSIVAGYCIATKTTMAEFEYSGTMTKDLFVSWFDQILVPELTPGKIIILDNAKVHKSPEILDLADSAGCKVVFLPPYSPDLNPIEKFWANLKEQSSLLLEKCLRSKMQLQMGFGELIRVSYSVLIITKKPSNAHAKHTIPNGIPSRPPCQLWLKRLS